MWGLLKASRTASFWAWTLAKCRTAVFLVRPMARPPLRIERSMTLASRSLPVSLTRNLPVGSCTDADSSCQQDVLKDEATAPWKASICCSKRCFFRFTFVRFVRDEVATYARKFWKYFSENPGLLSDVWMGDPDDVAFLQLRLIQWTCSMPQCLQVHRVAPIQDESPHHWAASAFSRAEEIMGRSASKRIGHIMQFSFKECRCFWGLQ